MPPPPSQRRVDRLQAAGAALALAAMLAVTVHAWSLAPDTALIRQGDADAPWIGLPGPPRSAGVGARADAVPAVAFTRRVEIADAASPARIELGALRELSVELNGRPVPISEDVGVRAWRTLDLAGALAPGVNELVVRVRNPRGPALLRVRALDRDVAGFATGAGWRVGPEGGPKAEAEPADDTRVAAMVYTTPRLADVLRARLPWLLGLLAVSGLAAALLGEARRAAWRSVLARAFWPAMALFWLAFAFTRAFRLPPYMGFDGPDHLAYVHALLAGGALPLATDGPMMYHPPLYYGVSAAAVALVGGPGAAGEAAALRVVTLLAGFAQGVVAWALASRLHPGEAGRARAAALFALLLPMNLYMSAYLSNEPLHGALAGGALWSTVVLLLADGLPMRWLLGSGALLGLAVLTKATSLLLLPIAVVFLAVKSAVADRATASTTALRCAVPAAVALVVGGWPFLRNQLELGQAVIGNWNVPGDLLVWWQAPGFHTPGYYLGFGQVLERPFFAGFHSFLDGMYATFWGDGLIGGIAHWTNRHRLWDYDAMATVYALALPATALLLYGFACLVRESFRGDDPRRRLALSFLCAAGVATGFALLYLTWVHPAYGMTKAFYGLSVLGVLALAAAEAATRVAGFLAERRWLAVVTCAWLGALVLSIGQSFLGSGAAAGVP